jgi:Txe/YoeB family toxin of Txe-Axe toxin-antitoxin module
MKRFIIVLLIKLMAFYYSIIKYIKVRSGKIIVSPEDIKIETSLVWKRKIAPKGKVFYIAKANVNGVIFTKNVSIQRRNMSSDDEAMLKWRAQRIFANTVTQQINK